MRPATSMWSRGTVARTTWRVRLAVAAMGLASAAVEPVAASERVGPATDTVEPSPLRDNVAAPDQAPDPSLGVPAGTPAHPSPEQQLLAIALAAEVDKARLELDVALGLEGWAAAAAGDAERSLDVERSMLAVADRRADAAAVALGDRRQRLRRWAVEAYTGAGLRSVSYVVEAQRINDVPRRIGLAAGAFGAAVEDVGKYEAAQAAAGDQRRRRRDAVATAEQRRAAAGDTLARAQVDVVQRRATLAALDAGQVASVRGVAFPVAAPSRFASTFGAARMPGTMFAHAHEGIDIFADPGTPVVAFERGMVTRLGTDILGGTKLWLIGESGTTYYYAHLLAFAPGLVDNQVVDVGRTLAYVGNTGNAARTPHHLHFEIHPAGGPAVDPYPVVARVAEVARAVREAHGAEVP